jgi:hypothetical protein
VELFALVRRQTEAPGPAPLAQTALNRATTALKQEPPGGNADGGQNENDEEGGEDPGSIKRQRPAHER